MHKFSGIVAGREDGGKFYIKVWLMQYADLVAKILEAKQDDTSVTNS